MATVSRSQSLLTQIKDKVDDGTEKNNESSVGEEMRRFQSLPSMKSEASRDTPEPEKSSSQESSTDMFSSSQESDYKSPVEELSSESSVLISQESNFGDSSSDDGIIIHVE